MNPNHDEKGRFAGKGFTHVVTTNRESGLFHKGFTNKADATAYQKKQLANPGGNAIFAVRVNKASVVDAHLAREKALDRMERAMEKRK